MTDDLIRLGLIDEEDILLDDAALTLALCDHPGVDDAPYRHVIAVMAARLDSLGEEAVEPAEQAELLSRVIGGEYGLAGDADTYDDPANADLIQVLDRRRGLPVSLSILYVALARRVGWTAHVLDVPGHVLILIGGEAAPIMIDPFRGGQRVNGEELAAMLRGLQPRRIEAASHVAVMPNRAVLVRLLLNQATRAEAAGQGRRALTLYRRMTVMAPAYGHAWWECARLELVDGAVADARKSLSAMLEITRDPALRARVSSVLESLLAD